MLGESINTVKNTEAPLETSREVGLEVNTEETKYSLRLVTSMQSKIINFLLFPGSLEV
jgi:hypothetical protein